MPLKETDRQTQKQKQTDRNWGIDHDDNIESKVILTMTATLRVALRITLKVKVI